MSKITYTPPFTIDSIFRALDVVPFSLPFSVIIPVLTALYDRRNAIDPIAVSSLSALKELLFTRYKWSGYVVVFILLRALSRHLSRRARNNGILTPDKPNWDRDVVVVTGGATGIGCDIVRVLSRNHRAKIAVLDICAPQYEPAANGAPEILYIKTDVTSAEAIAKAHATIREHFGVSPSYVVGCAGAVRGGSLLSVEPRHFQRIYDINAVAHIHLAQEFLPAMIERNHGHYVTVASSAAYYSPAMLGPYCMSKAAALTFHEQLLVELRVVYKRPNIRASVYTPTKVKTLLGHGLSSSKMSFLHPDLDALHVATSIVDTLNSGESQNVSQPYITYLLPFVRALPAWYHAFVSMLGDTDEAVTEKSIVDSFKNGYGKNWSKEDFEALWGSSASKLAGSN
ncbi:putative secondary metabolism biosynthetic enzyme [Malassezia cuniculi]|uniref:Secondary metabolism biosynthetic enzyme n=1 Tax=Malassezia cuniculi TaxID=948313 RepID=A0AAF0EVS3_9BASI|nr:putative secondary metabolism biosynthetic enzyme [Malassezia cuniculi]